MNFTPHENIYFAQALKPQRIPVTAGAAGIPAPTVRNSGTAPFSTATAGSTAYYYQIIAINSQGGKSSGIPASGGRGPKSSEKSPSVGAFPETAAFNSRSALYAFDPGPTSRGLT